MVYSWNNQELMEQLKAAGNMRTDVAVFIKNERLKPDNADEIVRLQQWETRLIKDIENLQTVIENNSRY
ncbi:MAG: hypothetical protein LBG52_07915 [Candidatus Peribacteria bacterium]|jgi:hypothetical protein|nr:hypothetical protein [Candidatus Peribacteria bacterium]